MVKYKQTLLKRQIMDKDTGFSTQAEPVRLFLHLIVCNLAINIGEDSKSFLSLLL